MVEEGIGIAAYNLGFSYIQQLICLMTQLDLNFSCSQKITIYNICHASIIK